MLSGRTFAQSVDRGIIGGLRWRSQFRGKFGRRHMKRMCQLEKGETKRAFDPSDASDSQARAKCFTSNLPRKL
jgi:hypothetical protein